jgi:hypothetical protein
VNGTSQLSDTTINGSLEVQNATTLNNILTVKKAADIQQNLKVASGIVNTSGNIVN